MITDNQAKHGIVENKKHNPSFRLIQTTIFDGYKFIDLVYGISNEGQNEGLEAYYKKEKDGHFYKSYRWLTDSVPPKYKRYFESLSSRKELCEDGHKITVKLTNE